jgi:hypothetical protein
MKIIFSILCLWFAGCVHFVKDDPYDRYYPKSPDWSLADVEHDPESRICYDCVYILDYSTSDIWSEFKYSVIRFFLTGQSMAYSTDDYRDISGANSFYNTAIGYFQLNGNLCVLETFSPLDGGMYGYNYGYLNDRGDIVITSFGYRGSRTHDLKKPAIYRKMKMDGLKPLVPDW